MSGRRRPRIALTLGDPSGIGPEVMAAALSRPLVQRRLSAVLYGDPAVLAEGASRARVPVPAAEHVDVASPGLPPCAGARDPSWARHQVLCLETTVEDALSGRVDAVVTGPIAKATLSEAGDFPGQTELFAARSKAESFAMMLAGPRLSVVLVTTHVPLAEVPSLLTVGRIAEKARLADAHFRRLLSGRAPSIAIAALNPHAGEGGLRGREDIEVIAPAVALLRSEGIDVHGPLAGDSVFAAASQGDFDVVVAMYHDQGLAPLKALHRHAAVNVTLGLPFPRVSPAHGPAFDIAGAGLANPESAVRALLAAARLARARKRWTAQGK